MVFHIAICSTDGVLRSRLQRMCMEYYSRRADACILLLYSTHSVWLVPAVRLDQAQQLSLLPGQGGKY